MMHHDPISHSVNLHLHAGRDVCPLREASGELMKTYPVRFPVVLSTASGSIAGPHSSQEGGARWEQCSAWTWKRMPC